jgi:parvulin-like peptidyl-prolyl isomerase
MAKAKAKAPTRAAESRAARARAHQRIDPERMNRLLILGGVGALVAIVLGIIAFGYWNEEIKPQSKTVVRVDDTEISFGHLQRRVELSVDQNSFLQQQSSAQILLALPETTAQQLKREAKVITAADELGISATDEEVEAAVLQDIDIPDESDPKVISEAIADKVDATGLHQDEYFWMIKAQVLEQKIRDHYTAQAPANEEQVKPRWIVVGDQETADAVALRIQNGDDFATVAREVSTDTASKEQGGAIDWRIRGTFNDAGDTIEGFLFSAAVGDVSEPLQGNAGFFIVKLDGKEAARKLTETQKSEYGSRELNEWLDELEVTHRVEQDLTEEDLRRIFEDLA